MSDPSPEDQAAEYADPDALVDDGDPGPEEPERLGVDVNDWFQVIDAAIGALELAFDRGPVEGATTGVHARWLVSVRENKRRLGDLEEKVSNIVGALMPKKTVVAEGLGVLSRHERTSRKQWDKEMLLRAVLDSRIVDKRTGEVKDETQMDRILHVWNLGAPRLTALRERGLDPDEFATVETKPGFNVEVKGA